MSTNIHINPSFNYGLFSQTGDSVPVAATTTEGTLIDGGVGSLSVPANGFKLGDAFRADFGGLISAHSGNTITIRIKAGATILCQTPAFTMPGITNQVWLLSINFNIRAIGAAGAAEVVTLGNFHVLKASSGTQEGFGFNTVNNTTFDTTIPNTLDVTVQWSSNNASNSIYSDTFVLNKIY